MQLHLIIMASSPLHPLLPLPVSKPRWFILELGFRFFLLFGSGLKHAKMPLAKDLLHPSPEEEKRKHKKKRLVQSPNSYFMDVKCPGKLEETSLTASNTNSNFEELLELEDALIRKLLHVL
ncbi:RS27 protein, partial [Polypterus senegalus]